MKKRISPVAFNLLIVSLVSIFLLIVLNFHYLLAYIQLPAVIGNDGPGQAAAGRYYADHIFPRTWGWISQWLGGMPFPQFYPPLFYMLVAAVYRITHLPYEFVFKLITVLLTLSIPGILAWITSKSTKNVGAIWLTGLSSVFLLSTTYRLYGAIGVTTQNTFDYGLVTQLLGFVMMLLWIGFFITAEKNIYHRYLSIFFLALVFISSSHVVIVAAMVFLAFLISYYLEHKSIQKCIKWGALYGALPLALVGFWYIPMLAQFKYVAGRSFGLDNGIGASNAMTFVVRWLHLEIITLAAVYIAFKKRDKTILVLAVTSVVIFITTIFHGELLFKRLPVHSYRSLPYFYLLSAVFLGYVHAYIQEYTSDRYIRSLSKWVPLAIIVCVWVTTIYDTNRSYYAPYADTSIQDTVDYMSTKEGRIHVESLPYSRTLEYFLSEINNQSGKNTLQNSYGILVESSVSSGIIVPFKNSLSQGGERYTLESHINYRDIKTQNMAYHIQRSRLLGINYFLISSPEMRRKFAQSTDVRLEKDLGTWQVYELKDVQYAQILTYEPAALFTALTFKGRDLEDINYMRFQEELFYRGTFDTILAYAQDQYLDTSSDLDRFKLAVISQYNYHNRDKAFKRLSEYAETHHLIAIENKDPLFNQLVELSKTNKNIHIFTTEKSWVLMSKVYNLVDKIKIPIPEASKMHITQALVSDTTIHIETNTPTEVPVLVKVSYFPDWKRIDNAHLYLATPSFMLTHIQKETTLEFTTNKFVYVGYSISGITLLIGLCFLYRDIKKESL
jgi:hypothetical protein